MDVSKFVTLQSHYDRRSEKLGESMYTRHGDISTLGTPTSEGIASFKLKELRPAWIIELIVSPTGKILNDKKPKIFRENIKVEEFVDPSPAYFQ